MTIPSACRETALHVGHKAADEVKAGQFTQKKGSTNIDIIDIRHDSIEINLKDEILKSLEVPTMGSKSLPTLLLYDEKGLQLFEEVDRPKLIPGEHC